MFSPSEPMLLRLGHLLSCHLGFTLRAVHNPCMDHSDKWQKVTQEGQIFQTKVYNEVASDAKSKTHGTKHSQC